MGKPFTIKQPPSVNVNARGQDAGPLPGKVILEAQRTGIPPACPDTTMPRDKTIDWPVAGGPDDVKKPYKLNK
jgi:hypothetical protein